MLVTIVAAVIVMVAYFLLLYGMVAFVQDKRFMSTAPVKCRTKVPFVTQESLFVNENLIL